MTKEEYKLRLLYLQGLKPAELLQELVAVLLGDGGATYAEKGPAQAVLDVEVKFSMSEHEIMAELFKIQEAFDALYGLISKVKVDEEDLRALLRSVKSEGAPTSNPVSGDG